MVVNAARVKDKDTFEAKDARLIHLLMREGHSSPFRHGYFQFHVECPIFVMRQLQKHQAGHSFNETSGRYSEIGPEFYQPTQLREQVGGAMSYTYKPMHDGDAEKLIHDQQRASWAAYRVLLNKGVAKEQARAVLPVGTYTEAVWSLNPLALLNFLELRAAEQAQEEIQVIAQQVDSALLATMPATYEAFYRCGRQAP